jgi:hypothetical protein
MEVGYSKNNGPVVRPARCNTTVEGTALARRRLPQRVRQCPI